MDNASPCHEFSAPWVGQQHPVASDLPSLVWTTLPAVGQVGGEHRWHSTDG